MQAADDSNRHIRFWGWALAGVLYALLATGFVMVDMRDVHQQTRGDAASGLTVPRHAVTSSADTPGQMSSRAPVDRRAVGAPEG